jgi:hypothetical protein
LRHSLAFIREVGEELHKERAEVVIDAIEVEVVTSPVEATIRG